MIEPFEHKELLSTFIRDLCFNQSGFNVQYKYVFGGIYMNKTYPVLYTTSVKGSTFKHCGIYPTLYFKVHADKERIKSDSQYKSYMQLVDKEVLDAITHKFLISIPITVTNDHIPFIIFKDNIDLDTVKLFCKAILDEISFFTKTKHTADYVTLETMLMVIDKDPSPFKASKVGDKLTQTSIIQDNIELLTGDGKDEDSGILTPYDVFLDLNKKKENQRSENKEEIVTW